MDFFWRNISFPNWSLDFRIDWVIAILLEELKHFLSPQVRTQKDYTIQAHLWRSGKASFYSLQDGYCWPLHFRDILVLYNYVTCCQSNYIL
jgi:hypothetical protein